MQTQQQTAGDQWCSVWWRERVRYRRHLIVGLGVVMGCVLSTPTSAVSARQVIWRGYVGPTTGAMGHPKGADSLCHATYAGSHWASEEELIELGADYPWTFRVWLRIGALRSEFTGGGDQNWAVSYSAVRPTSAARGATCNGWNSASTVHYGAYLGTAGSTGTDPCNNSYRIACVED